MTETERPGMNHQVKHKTDRLVLLLILLLSLFIHLLLFLLKFKKFHKVIITITLAYVLSWQPLHMNTNHPKLKRFYTALYKSLIHRLDGEWCKIQTQTESTCSRVLAQGTCIRLVVLIRIQPLFQPATDLFNIGTNEPMAYERVAQSRGHQK